MSEQQAFTEIPLGELLGRAAQMKAQGWRFVQCHATRGAEIEQAAQKAPAGWAAADAETASGAASADASAADAAASPEDPTTGSSPTAGSEPATPVMVPTFELTYSFSDDAARAMTHLRVVVTQGQSVPSVSSLFPVAFMFENEMHDLFGIAIEGISIDFKGGFYHLHYPTPMAQAPEKPARKVAPKKPEAGRPGKPKADVASDAN